MEITKEQIQEKIHECHMKWAQNIVDLAKKHGLDWDAQLEFINLTSSIIDHAWAETRYGIYVVHNEPMEKIYYDKYLPIYGSMIEADMDEVADDEKEFDDFDDLIDHHSDMVNRAHEASEGMER